MPSKDKLKILKDLTGMIGMLPLKSDILDINVVKQEAIKWFKRLVDNAQDPSTCAWIKVFFNITEEDLK